MGKLEEDLSASYKVAPAMILDQLISEKYKADAEGVLPKDRFEE